MARGRLVRRLVDAHELPLVVLTAPAGYGKTTTLLDWAQHDPRPFAWVALDRADDDPDHLLASVARSTGALPQRGAAPVLVLDGVDFLRSEAAIDALSHLVEHPPAGAQIAVATRAEPPLRLGRLRAQREVLELNARDFVMTRGEAAELLERAELTLGAAEVDELVARTEGWPVGLYLAALSLRDRTDDAGAVGSFAGDDRVVADYVADAVLADLSTEQVTFLLRTAPLERLSGPLCDAVLGEQGTAALLKQLARANVLLVSLDRTDEWYRYHRLFAQALRAELRRREPSLEPELHRRAARWHAEHGDVDAAVRHAAAACDAGLAGDLLWAHAPRYIAEGHQGCVRRWIGHFTDAQAADNAPLALVVASSHLARGERDLAEHWTLVAARAIDDRGHPTETPGLDAAVAAMRAAIARDGIERVRDDAARARDLALEGSPWLALACHLEGTACHLLGEREPAEALLRDGVRRGLVAAPCVSALCFAQLALLALEEGDRHGSDELASRARMQVERLRVVDDPSMSLVLAVSALIKARLGQVEVAKADAAAATRLADALADVAPWYRAQTEIVLARALIALADVATARALLDDAACVLGDAPDTALLTAWLDEARDEADACSASVTSTLGSLTIAELRILRMLPTHLSFREMGSQLYVSPNTVKTQAQAVYRKLDASSRSEAVARARDLGLLGDAATP